jgi:hypothetical protein
MLRQRFASSQSQPTFIFPFVFIFFVLIFFVFLLFSRSWRVEVLGSLSGLRSHPRNHLVRRTKNPYPFTRCHLIYVGYNSGRLKNFNPMLLRLMSSVFLLWCMPGIYETSDVSFCLLLFPPSFSDIFLGLSMYSRSWGLSGRRLKAVHIELRSKTPSAP